MREFDIQEIKDYIKEHPNAEIYIGCDSLKVPKKKRKRKKERIARFTTIVVVYEKDKNRVFMEDSIEPIYDTDPSKPSLRLMTEVYKVSEIVTELADVLENRDFEIHLDINPKKTEGSHCVYHQAVGYIKGVHGIDPVTKPDAFVSSVVADHFVRN